MPTDNPRVNVTLSPSLDSLVGRLASLQRMSKSSVLRELLEAAAPALSRSVALMEAAARSKPAVLRGLAASLSQEQARIEGHLEGTLSALEGQADLVEQAEAVRGKRPARRRRQTASQAGGGIAPAVASAPNPPASNRGVKSPTKPQRGAVRQGSAPVDQPKKRGRAS
jgi:hypothetical protein